jgi:ankyrin repeat protein
MSGDESKERAMASAEQDLLDAVGADDAARVAELVATDPFLATVRDRDGVSAIMRSRYRFDRATTDALLAVDPELDVFEATALGYIDRLRERLDEDPARALAFSTDGFTALHFAAFFGKGEAARMLIASGAEVGAVSRNDLLVQPLHSAAAGLHHEVCRVLIAAGADVNARQAHAFTPLHAAAQHGDDELVELLLSAGSDPTARTDAGATPADTADAAGHMDVARRLRQVAEERSASV